MVRLNRQKGCVKMRELKPCPFCGRTPIVDDCGDNIYFVKCKCGIAQDKLYAQKCDAVRRWNTRKTGKIVKDTNVPSNDCISRQAAIDTACKSCNITRDYHKCDGYSEGSLWCDEVVALRALPSAQPTLYGYDIEHLKLIANVLQKENLPAERVTDALMDIGRIVAIVRNEFEETIKECIEAKYANCEWKQAQGLEVALERIKEAPTIEPEQKNL